MIADDLMTRPNLTRSAPRFFINYSTDDRKLARKLHDDLREQGANVYQFEKSVRPGTDAWKQVLEAIDRSDWFVALLTPSAAKSNPILAEISHANHRHINNGTPTLIPAIVKPVDKPTELVRFADLPFANYETGLSALLELCLPVERVQGAPATHQTKAKKAKRSPPSRVEVLEAALDFATDPIVGLEMDRDEALDWAQSFADQWSMDQLKTYKMAFNIGRDDIEWPLDKSMHCGRAVLEWKSDQFDTWCKVFEWLVSISGPYVPPEDAVGYSNQFVSLHPERRNLRDFKRAVKVAMARLDMEGIEAVEFALGELQRG